MLLLPSGPWWNQTNDPILPLDRYEKHHLAPLVPIPPHITQQTGRLSSLPFSFPFSCKCLSAKRFLSTIRHYGVWCVGKPRIAPKNGRRANNCTRPGRHHRRGAVNVRKYIFITIIKLNWRLQMALWVACYRSGSASLHFTSWRGQIVPIDPRKDQTVRCFNILPITRAVPIRCFKHGTTNKTERGDEHRSTLHWRVLLGSVGVGECRPEDYLVFVSCCSGSPTASTIKMMMMMMMESAPW